MLTVQDWLKMTSKKEILDQYRYHYPPDYYMIENKDLTLAQINDRLDLFIGNLIDSLIEITPASPDDGEQMAFFVGYSYLDDIVDEQVFYVRFSELDNTEIADADVNSYSCLFIPYAEIAGTVVADNEATHKNMAYLLAYILNEISFFGDEKQMEEERKALKEEVNEIESGAAKYVSADELFAGFDRRKKFSLEEEYVSAVRQKEIELNQYLYASSVRDVRISLKE